MISSKVNELYDLLSSSVLALSSNELDDLYSELRNFRGPTTKLVLDKSRLVFPAGVSVGVSAQFVNDRMLFGVDLPYWFDAQNGNSTDVARVMIIGIDPLRNDKTFEVYNAKKEDQIIVGTPYAVHDGYLKQGKTAVYWKLIDALISNNFVYLTDVFKCYSEDRVTGKGSYTFFEWNKVIEPFTSILVKEISIVKPDIIVTFGGMAFNAINELQSRYPLEFTSSTIVSLLHPAARASAWEKRLQGRSATVDNRVDFMKEQLAAFIAIDKTV